MDLSTNTVPLWVAGIAAVIAAITEIRRFKVYNVLTFPMLFAGLLYHAWTGGWAGAAGSAAGVIAGFLMLLIPYLMGGLGAGDVKFMMALGAWLGVRPLVPIFGVAAVATAAYAIVLSARGGSLRSLWWSTQVSCLRLLAMGRMLAADDCREDYHDWVGRPDAHKRLIPFAAMLGIGLAVTVLFWSWN